MKNNNYEINIFDGLIHIKNYISVIDISSNLIEIKLNNKVVKIKGSKLIINKLDKYELCIIGILEGIMLIDEK